MSDAPLITLKGVTKVYGTVGMVEVMVREDLE